MLHIFDMDGTLLRGTIANLEVAKHYGSTRELAELEARFAAGTLDTKGFSATLRELWDGLTSDVVLEAFTASPWLSGISDVCADIRERGERSVVITMSPDFFARHLLALGFDEVVASRFPPLPFTEPLDLANVLTPDDKPRIAERLCARFELTWSACVAYGDSMSDAPLFRRLTHTVAVNADHHLADLAALDYRGVDLVEAYRLARTLVRGQT